MPTLKHLLEELKQLRVDPEEIRISGKLYDNLIADADDSDEEEE